MMPPTRLFHLSALLASYLLAAVSARADVRLPALFSDHLVLQKSQRVPVWGWADPGEKVSVNLADARAEAMADSNGKWRVTLDLSAYGSGPYELFISGKNRLVVTDVVVGEVWLCSGQSNMELRLFHSLGSKAEASATTLPLLREFTVIKKLSPTPLEDCEGRWVAASGKSILDFGGVSYYFGKRLHQELGVPVGLIRAAWGGTCAEAWTSAEALESDPDLKAGKEKVTALADGAPALEGAYHEQYRAWLKANDRQDRPHDQAAAAASPGLDLKEWKTIQLPGDWKNLGLPENGAVWVRREIEVDARSSSEGWLEMVFTSLGGFHEVYWDGQKIGGTAPGEAFPDIAPRYRVGGDKLKQGTHTLALRLFNPAGRGGFLGPAEYLQTGPGKIQMAGEWRARVEFELPPVAPEQLAALPKVPARPPFPHHVASRLYNAMIHPLIPYAIRGVVWYQGESNAGRARQYHTVFPLLVQSWRAVWGEGDFPFYFCQLANFGARPTEPGDSAWAELREAQAETLVLPATGQAILLGTGLTEDIHSQDRREQGERIARVTLAKTYGRKEPCEGPIYASMSRDGDRIRVRFRTSGALVAAPIPKDDILRYSADQTPVVKPLKVPLEGSALQGFAVCGADRRWKWAQAVIEGDGVVVTSPEVPEPVAVRYAWADNPVANLTDATGLPAAPFRTDRFPFISNDRYFQDRYPQESH